VGGHRLADEDVAVGLLLPEVDAVPGLEHEELEEGAGHHLLGLASHQLHAHTHVIAPHGGEFVHARGQVGVRVREGEEGRTPWKLSSFIDGSLANVRPKNRCMRNVLYRSVHTRER
jgi:hypothetical protein